MAESGRVHGARREAGVWKDFGFSSKVGSHWGDLGFSRFDLYYL